MRVYFFSEIVTHGQQLAEVEAKKDPGLRAKIWGTKKVVKMLYEQIVNSLFGQNYQSAAIIRHQMEHYDETEL